MTTGNSRTAVGRAPIDWSVEVCPVGGTPTAASRIDDFYYQNLTAGNSSTPVWQSVVTRRSTGTPTSTGNLWYAKQSVAPEYDYDGNLTDDGRWFYTWDAENPLIQMESSDDAVAAGHPYTKLAFVYDWEGKRIQRTVWQGGNSSSPTFQSCRRWIYDGWNPIVELDWNPGTSTLTRLRTFTWGLDLSGTLQGAGSVGGLIAQTTVSGSVVRRPSYDGNGNIVAWARNNTTAAECRREYDAFGNILISEGNIPSEYGFSTKVQDPGTGLSYYGYRYYDPIAGRWIGRDPIEEEGGMNLYGFIANNGINSWDVSGLLQAGQQIDVYCDGSRAGQIVISTYEIIRGPDNRADPRKGPAEIVQTTLDMQFIPHAKNCCLKTGGKLRWYQTILKDTELHRGGPDNPKEGDSAKALAPLYDMHFSDSPKLQTNYIKMQFLNNGSKAGKYQNEVRFKTELQCERENGKKIQSLKTLNWAFYYAEIYTRNPDATRQSGDKY